jgi:hypothetical protein
MKRITLASLIICVVVAVSFMPSCKKSSSSTPAAKPTLYDSLGGTTMVADPATSSTAQIEKGRLLIRNIIDSTIFVIAADDSINVYFKTLLMEVGSGNLSGFEELSKNLTDFVCVGTGAKDYTYTGLSMPAAHNPATNPRINGVVSDGAFTEFENDLVMGAGKAGVPSNTPALGSVAKIVESLRSSVVGQ